MSQPQLFDAVPCGHRPLVIHGAGPFDGRVRLLGRASPCRFVLTTRAAAQLWGLDVPRRLPSEVPLELAVPARGDPPLYLPPEDVAEVDGLRLTTPERTAFDCARVLPRYEALALVDQFLARGVSRPALMSRAHRATGPGATQSRAVIAMADPASQSPGESLVRGVLLDTGFPRPTCQLPAPPTPYLDAWLTLLLQSGWSPTPTHLTTLTHHITHLPHPLRLTPATSLTLRRSSRPRPSAAAIHAVRADCRPRSIGLRSPPTHHARHHGPSRYTHISLSSLDDPPMENECLGPRSAASTTWPLSSGRFCGRWPAARSG